MAQTQGEMRCRFILIFGLALAVVTCGGDDEPVQEQQPQEEVQAPPPVAQATPEPEPEPEPISVPLYMLQIGAFLNPDSAVVQKDRMAVDGR